MSDEKVENEIEKRVIRSWYYDQTTQRQAEIAKPAFDAEHPTSADKKEAVKKYRAG